MPAPFVIKSLQHPLVKHLVKLRTNKSYRRQQKRLVLSSPTVISEVAPSTHIRSLLISEDEELYSGFTFDSLYLVTPEILKKVSGLQTASGCIAEVDLPQPAPLTDAHRLLILAKLGDPGNVGTLARTALALGWDGLFLTTDTADPFNDKAVRAARGALFRLPYREGSTTDLEALLHTYDQVLIADTKGTPVQSVAAGSKLALILSSEAHGPDDKIARLGQRIAIPMTGPMESLNVAVAGGILISRLVETPSVGETNE